MVSSTRTLQLDGVDPRSALATHGPQGTDPTTRWLDDGYVRAVHTPGGSGTLELRWTGTGEVTAEAWGDGAAWLLDHADAWLGLRDDVSGFDGSGHPAVRRWWRASQGDRIGSSGLVWQELVPVILGQRVTAGDALRGWTKMCQRWGSAAPGPHGLALGPTSERLRTLTYDDFHDLDIERRRGEAILSAARHSRRLEEAATMAPADALQRLTALPGLGVWTATAVINVCHGDPDMVLRGDFWLPTIVTYNLQGDPAYHTDDERLMAAIEPFAGHRWRACRLILSAGTSPPRRAPRQRPQRIARY